MEIYVNVPYNLKREGEMKQNLSAFAAVAAAPSSDSSGSIAESRIALSARLPRGGPPWPGCAPLGVCELFDEHTPGRGWVSQRCPARAPHRSQVDSQILREAAVAAVAH